MSPDYQSLFQVIGLVFTAAGTLAVLMLAVRRVMNLVLQRIWNEARLLWHLRKAWEEYKERNPEVAKSFPANNDSDFW